MRVIQPGRPRSLSRSSASSFDVDEMLIQASTGDEHPGATNGYQVPPQYAQGGHRAKRSMIDPRGEVYRTSVQGYPASLSRKVCCGGAAWNHRLTFAQEYNHHPPPQGTGAQIQQYQTHIFAPPVTGAPIKKSKYSSMTNVGGSMGVVSSMGM